MGAVRSHPPRPRTTATSLVKTDLGHDDTLVFNGGNVTPADDGLGEAAT